MMAMNVQMTFSEILEKVCEIIGLDRILGPIKFTMRFSMFGLHVIVPTYDNSLKGVWCRRHKGMDMGYVTLTCYSGGRVIDQEHGVWWPLHDMAQGYGYVCGKLQDIKRGLDDFDSKLRRRLERVV